MAKSAKTKTKAVKAAKPSRKKAKRKKKSMMKNLVGHTVPTAAEVQKVGNTIEGVTNQAEKYTLVLTPEQRQEALKWRPGGDQIFLKIAGLVKKHGAVIPNMTVADMEADYLLSQRLAPLAPLIERLALVIDDTMLQAQGECWWAVTTYYGILDQMSSADAKLNEDLKTVREFFATGARATEEESTTEDTTTPAPEVTEAVPVMVLKPKAA